MLLGDVVYLQSFLRDLKAHIEARLRRVWETRCLVVLGQEWKQQTRDLQASFAGWWIAEGGWASGQPAP